MKQYYKIPLLTVLALCMTNCDNDFMDRFPETEISPEAFSPAVLLRQTAEKAVENTRRNRAV